MLSSCHEPGRALGALRLVVCDSSNSEIGIVDLILNNKKVRTLKVLSYHIVSMNKGTKARMSLVW